MPDCSFGSRLEFVPNRFSVACRCHRCCCCCCWSLAADAHTRTHTHVYVFCMYISSVRHARVLPATPLPAHTLSWPRPRILQCRHPSIRVLCLYMYICICVCILSILFYVHLFTVLDSEICTAGCGRHGTSLTFSQISNEYVFLFSCDHETYIHTHTHVPLSHLYRSLRSQLQEGHTARQRQQNETCNLTYALA